MNVYIIMIKMAITTKNTHSYEYKIGHVGGYRIETGEDGSSTRHLYMVPPEGVATQETPTPQRGGICMVTHPPRHNPKRDVRAKKIYKNKKKEKKFF